MMNENFAELDEQDPLRGFREYFYRSDADLIYLDGNSLGRMPMPTRELIREVAERQWGDRLIRGWNEGWMDINRRVGEKIARLIGAQPQEVILTDSTSLNLFKLAYGALKDQDSQRTQIISDELNFPSDLYVLQGLIDLFGNRHELVLAQSADGISIPEDSVAHLLTQQTALLTLSHVCFKTAFRYDMNELTRAAHDQGAYVIWDLSHSVGAVPIDLNAADADMAVGCTYKYLNGGPGSPAFLYVREDLQDKIIQPVWGWFGDARPFDFDLSFQPAAGIQRYATSTTPILSASAVAPGVDLLIEAGMTRVHEKSVQLCAYLIQLFDVHLAPLGFRLGSPRQPEKRGSHVSIRHPEGYRIAQAMIHPKEGEPVIIPDFRDPDYIRLGIAPLYTSYRDIYRSVLRMRDIVSEHEYENHPQNRQAVT